MNIEDYTLLVIAMAHDSDSKKEVRRITHSIQTRINVADGAICGDNFVGKIDFPLDLIKCSICQELITGNIMSCEVEHSICYEDYTSLTDMEHGHSHGSCVYKCPVCRREGTINRNYMLEKCRNNLMENCKNNGCKVRYYKHLPSDHEKKCKYGNIQCYICSKEMTYAGMTHHLIQDCAQPFKFAKIDKCNLLELLQEKKFHYILTSNIPDLLVVIRKVTERRFELYAINNREDRDYPDLELVVEKPANIISDDTKKTQTDDHEQQHDETKKTKLSKNINNVCVNSVQNFKSSNVVRVSLETSILKNATSVYIENFVETYATGSRWRYILEGKDSIAEITEHVYYPEEHVFVRFLDSPNGPQRRINKPDFPKLLDVGNEVILTEQQLGGMSFEEQLALAMSNSSGA